MAARAFAGPEHLLLVIASCRSAMPARAPSWLARAALPGTRRRMSSAPESRGVYTSQTTGKRYMAVVGLEIHAQLNSRSKLFSDSDASVEGIPNTNVTIFDAAIPGSLPRLNPECVRQALRTALALQARVNFASTFDRKHYFYQDIPLGYQITQKHSPIATGGKLALVSPQDGVPYSVDVPLVQIQLEQDTARSTILSSPTFAHFRHYSLIGIDLNRAGVGLVEIVTEPALRSGQEASAFVRKLASILGHIGSVRPGGMEGGALRVDVNVSVVPEGADPSSGTRVEVKNLNSVRSVGKAVDYEVERHVRLIEGAEDGGLRRETRSWDETKEATVTNRVKEEKEDYRYMPDGELPVLRVNQAQLDELQASMPPLPDQIRADLVAKHGPNGLTMETAAMIFNEPGAVAYFEELVTLIYGKRRAAGVENKDVKDAANWLVQTLFGVLHGQAITALEASSKGFGPEVLADVVYMAETGVVSQLSAKFILSNIADGETGTPMQIAQARGYVQDSSESNLRPLVRAFVAENQDRVEQIRKGKTGLVGWFVGELRRKSGSKGDPVVIKRLVEEEIGVRANKA